MKFLEKLKNRWNLKNYYEVLIILVVFALTGFTVLALKSTVLHFFFKEENPPVIFSILYYIVILPFYNLILLLYGSIFGRFKFFWEFEKKMFKRIFRKKD